VHPDDWWLLGFGWRGTWLGNQFLPLGSRRLPAIFDFFTSALECILQTQWGLEYTLPYLDDFLAIFPRSAASVAPDRYKGDLSQICCGLGF